MGRNKAFMNILLFFCLASHVMTHMQPRSGWLLGSMNTLMSFTFFYKLINLIYCSVHHFFCLSDVHFHQEKHQKIAGHVMLWKWTVSWDTPTLTM